MTTTGSSNGNLRVKVASGDVFDIREFSVHEQMSSLFNVSLIALSDNPNIDFESVVGQPASFRISLGAGKKRYWTGICNELQQLVSEESGLSTYRLSIVPTLWLLTQRRNYRIFQQLSEPDIVKKMLGEWGIEADLKIDKAAYKKRKYRVQYAESDYAFVCRMLEDAGISFYFEQKDKASVLVLSDAPQSNEARPNMIPFRDNPTSAEREHVTDLRVGRKVRPGKYTMRDHDYRRPPNYKLMSSAGGGTLAVEEKLERYHYTPGAFLFGTDKGDDSPSADDKGKARTDEAEAAVLAQKRLAAKRGSATTFTFNTNAHDLAPGVVMSVLDHPRTDLGPKRRLLIIETMIDGTHDGDWGHSCEARSADAPFRPSVSTPKPKISGVESATVVGPPGEEIHCDEFGRVRVHFHWDRESKMDDNSSCWIHVSQPWGGAGFGGMNLPRVGQEVLVDFLGGDPDRPVITGRLFTNLQKVPYKLPDNKTQSGLKSNSTTGTGGYNELMFEDAAGKELVRMQAEKDYNKLVKHDENATIGNDRTKLVKNNEAVTIGNDRTKLVKNNEAVTIGNDRTKVVKNNEDVTIGNNLSALVKSNMREVTGMNRSQVVGVNRSTQVGGIDSTIVGVSHSIMVSPPGEGGGGGSTAATMENQKIILTTGGGATITLEGATITMEADNIFLQANSFLGASSMGQTVVGGASGVTVGSSGGDVLIQGGPMVKINP
jgi:type VI secretion system secreted protein VgrG